MAVRVQRLSSLDGLFEIDVKRFNVPYLVYSDCPHCGNADCFTDLSSDQYLSYPIICEPKGVSIYCPKCEEHHEVLIQLDIVVTAVVQSNPPKETP